MEDVKRMIAQKKSLKKQTVKLYKLLGKKQDRLPWKEIIQEVPNIVEAIEKIEADKPRPKIVSPFRDDESKEPTAPEEGKIDMAADHGSPLSCPIFDHAFEMYEWFYKNNPEKLNIADLGWIDWFEDGYMGRHLESESEQSNLKYLLCVYRLKINYDGDGGGGQESRKDYRLGLDPVVEKRWRDIKNTIIVDPISGLSGPAKGLPPDNERTKYGFYRGIERRFPGTLTDSDWEEVKKYEGSREWELIFSKYEIYHLPRTIGE